VIFDDQYAQVSQHARASFLKASIERPHSRRQQNSRLCRQDENNLSLATFDLPSHAPEAAADYNDLA
jgi:hypothetical protein